MHVVLQSQKDSTFPILYGTFKDDLIFVTGGGGSSRSGVKNMIQIYNKSDLKKPLSQFDLGQEYGQYIYLYKSDNNMIVVTSKSVILIQINYKTFEMTQIDKIAPNDEISTAISTGEYVVIKSGNNLIYFTVGNNNLKQVYVDKVDYNGDPIKQIVPYKQNDENGIIILTDDNVIYHPQPFVSVNDEISEKEISDVKLDVQPCKKAVQLNKDILFFSYDAKKNVTVVHKYNKKFQLLQKKILKFRVSIVNQYNNQLLLSNDTGKIYLYSNKLKRLCSKQSPINTMMTLIQKQNNDLLITSVQKLVTYSINNNDTILLVSLIIGAYIASLIFVTFL